MNYLENLWFSFITSKSTGGTLGVGSWCGGMSSKESYHYAIPKHLPWPSSFTSMHLKACVEVFGNDNLFL